MPKHISAKEFRQRFPYVGGDLKRWGEIVILGIYYSPIKLFACPRFIKYGKSI